MALFKTFLLAALAAATSANAQSVNPGLGSNPKAQGATAYVTTSTGANGSEDWLDTDIAGNGSGWSSPFMALEDIYYISLSNFYGGFGAPCAKYDQYFQSPGSDTGGPTPGLMQVPCDNYPDGVCTDSIQDNVNAGASYSVTQLDNPGGNVLLAFGSYNGWITAGSGLNNNKGLTENYPCSPEGQAHGMPQNLDYLHRVLNGWLMGLDVYGADNWIGTYKCSQSCTSESKC